MWWVIVTVNWQSLESPRRYNWKGYVCEGVSGQRRPMSWVLRLKSNGKKKKTEDELSNLTPSPSLLPDLDTLWLAAPHSHHNLRVTLTAMLSPLWWTLLPNCEPKLFLSSWSCFFQVCWHSKMESPNTSSMVVHTYNSSTQESDARGLGVQGQPVIDGEEDRSCLYVRPCFKKERNSNNKNTSRYGSLGTENDVSLDMAWLM